MSRKIDPELIDDENPEWMESDVKRAVPFSALSSSLQRKLRRGQRGVQKAPTKVQTAVRYDPDVVEHFKAQGPGWQTRMNDALKKAILAGIA
ncbi:MAG: BrnA antitoxin family protein [Burkholderiaceae bacterium]